jgi:carbonic anhydrase
LQGPAEPLQFNYLPSSGTVVNNGHTVQVDVLGDNSLTVRGSSYKLVQFHFHHPSEERVNDRGFAMVAHLVHRNAEGQLAVVAVLLEPGEVNPLVNKVWTYMPLDAGDRVRMPAELLNMNELLPKDQRYYQFMGSLTTPPCTENVLWMVLKSPMTVSREQLKLFSQLFPNNARPSQPSYGRVVRDAQ